MPTHHGIFHAKKLGNRVHIFIFVSMFLYSFFHTVFFHNSFFYTVLYQVFLINTNILHTIIWFLVFLSNTNEYMVKVLI